MKKPIQFGKYYLLERVNVGGMAEVFKAKAMGVEGFERLLAVKRILPNIAEDKEFITMFIDEAKIAVQLSHANIAQIFDLGKEGDSYFIALEYIAGKDLRALFDRCKQRPENGASTMPISQSCFVIMKVCEGLDYAHNKKDASGRDIHLVHRDVSPQNVLISYEGEVKVIDFGIAKAAGKASKTQAGILKGKFGYMSPEQVRGLPLDRRSDIFALGIVLYELLTGERLFVGESDFSTLEKVRNVEILPPSAYNRKIPEELERIVLKALAKDVEDRYQNAIDLHDDLQAFMYTAGEFFSRKEMSAWMKRQFQSEIQAESARDEEYSQMAALPAPEAPGAPVGRSTKVATPAVPKKTMPPPSPAPINGAPPRATAAKLAVVAAPTDDLSWDDDELETHVYDSPADLEDEDDEESDDTPMPSLDELELSDDGAPVPAKRSALASEPPPPARNGSPRPGSEPYARIALATHAVAGSSAVQASGGAPQTREREERRSMPTTPAILRQSVISPSVVPPSKPATVPPQPANRAAPGTAPGARPTPVIAPAPVASARPAPVAVQPAAKPVFVSPRVPIDTAAPVLTGPGRRQKASGLPLYLGLGMVAALALAFGLYFVLRTTTGRIELVTVPADGVRVAIDDQAVAPAGLADVKWPPGAHTIVVEHDGYKSWSQRIELKAGEVVSRAATLERLPGAILVLRSDPGGATASLDGKILGVTPFQASEIMPGKHVIEIKLNNLAWTQTLEFLSGKTVELNPKLASLAAPPIAAPPPVVAPPVVAPPVVAPPVVAAAVAVVVPPVAVVVPPVARPVAVAVPPAAPPSAPPVAVAPTVTQKPNRPVLQAPTRPSTARPPHEERETLASAGRHPKVVSPPEHRPEAPLPNLPKPPPPTPKVEARVVPAGEGFLRLGSKPWTKIAVDGKDSGLNTPQTHLRLNAGAHRITLSNPQFGITETFSVDIKTGETETVVKDLRKPSNDPEE